MILLQLFGVFARVGAVTFGGGYAMVALIERELSDRGWLSGGEFADIVAVSQMTPGPLALNVATYVGRQIAGIPGALSASFGLAAPAVIITAAALVIIRRSRSMSWARAAVRGIRGAVLGLIGTSVFFFLETSVLKGLPDGPIWSQSSTDIIFSPAAAAIFILALIITKILNQGPMRVIAGAAALGVLAYLPGWL